MSLIGQAIAGVHRGPFDEGALREKFEEARRQLPDGHSDLVLVFVTAPLVHQAADILEIAQVHARARVLAGCSGRGVIGNDEEVEDGPAVAFCALHLPGAHVVPVHISASDLQNAEGPTWWHSRCQVGLEASRGWMAFVDPFSMDAEAWLRQWNDAYPGVATVGGLAGGAPQASQTHLFLNQQVHTDGCVALSIGGNVALEPLVSQGCRPIGRPWTVTAADRNLIQKIGNLPALSVLQDTFDSLPAADKARAGGNIFVGLAMNEYQEEHRRGDFLVRNLLAADPQSGVVAVGAKVRVGQTLQFQFRDSASADEDLSSTLEVIRSRLSRRRVLSACLCSCAGRGSRLFGQPHHDARRLHGGLGTEVPLAGFFGNGEIGPVGGRNYVHGYTASAALFTTDEPPPSG
ncbi:MAG: FIST C-terminal domain-containing protein [Verrucomicrobiales bacterium]|nr:FIST C-terminal domain-containing protein [Verrucomicrobiales bacterium]